MPKKKEPQSWADRMKPIPVHEDPLLQKVAQASAQKIGQSIDKDLFGLEGAPAQEVGSLTVQVQVLKKALWDSQRKLLEMTKAYHAAMLKNADLELEAHFNTIS